MSLAFITLPSRADDPPQAPVVQKVFSMNRRFFAVLDPGKKVVTVFKQPRTGKAQKFWEMPASFPDASISDDGRYIVSHYAGGNLLDLNHGPGEVMFSIYDRGRLVAQVRLDQLIEEKQLVRTDSHYLWATSFGFVTGHHFRVETVDHRVHVFDVATGRDASGLLRR